MNKIIIFFVACGLISISIASSAANKIRFGVDYFYPPFVFTTKSGYYHGFDIEVAKGICKQLNAECTFTAMSLSQLFASLDQNKVDAIMGALSITPARKERFAFTRPYLKSTMSFVSLATSDIDPNNLQGKKVGVVNNSTFYTYLKSKYGNTIKLVPFETNEALANGLTNKQADIILLDTPAANYWVGYSMNLFKIVGTPTYLAFDEGYGIVLRKDNMALLTAFNNALDSMVKQGTLEKLRQAYFPEEQSH